MQSDFNMNQPVVLCAKRRIGYRFMAAEAAWIMSGDNRVSSIAPYSKEISKFSDDGIYFHGAYGPKIVDQLTYVVDSLVKDDMTRQAVLSVWRENPRGSKDVPCTLSAQFQLRQNTLYTFLTMRSSDVWLGVPYDVFNFSMLSAMVALMVEQRTEVPVYLGTLTLTAGNQHVYARDFERIEEVLNDPELITTHPVDFDHHAFQTHEHLISYLWQFARGEINRTEGFLGPLRKEN